MNASQFMDKQIMELSASGAHSSDLLDLLDPPEKHRSNGTGSGAGGKKDDMLPNYDFQPIRSVGSSPAPATVEGGKAWGSVDSIPTSSNFRERVRFLFLFFSFLLEWNLCVFCFTKFWDIVGYRVCHNLAIGHESSLS